MLEAIGHVSPYHHDPSYGVHARARAPESLVLFVGTGGNVLLVGRKQAFGTASALDPRVISPYSYLTPPGETAQGVPATPASMLKTVRETFGLNIKQSARVFDVERPTIYLWSTTSDAGKLRTANFERMRQLYKIAEKCSAMGPRPSDALQLVLDDGSTLLDQLSSTPLDEHKILGAWNQLGTMKDRLSQARRKRTEEFGKAIATGVASLSDKEALKQDLAKLLGHSDQQSG